MSASPSNDPQDALLPKVLEQQRAKRLLEMLDTTSTLSCDEAQALLPALVEAELSGKDPEKIEEFRILLQHLETCDTCMDFYVDLSQKLAAVVEPPQQEQLPEAEPVLGVVRQGMHGSLSMLRGVANWFLIRLTPPALPAPQMLQVLGADPMLYVDELPEVKHQPQVSVSVDDIDRPSGADQVDLQVVIQTIEPSARWEVQISYPPITHSTTTDAMGVAFFEAIPVTNLRDLTLAVKLLDDQSTGDRDGAIDHEG